MPPVLLVVGLYVLATAPLLYLALRVHALQSDYTRLFMAALLLQIIPLGLIYLPFGLVGLGLLLWTLFATHRRNARFRAMGIANPEVEHRWRLEYHFNVWALGFSIQQKAVAYLFVDVVSHRGFGFLWLGVLPTTLLLWGALAVLVARRLGRLRARASE